LISGNLVKNSVGLFKVANLGISTENTGQTVAIKNPLNGFVPLSI